MHGRGGGTKDKHPYQSTVRREHYTLGINSMNQRSEKPEQHFYKLEKLEF
jgi:hypothetical protein